MEKKRFVGIIIFGLLLFSIGGLFFYWFSFPFIRSLIKERFNLAMFRQLGPSGSMGDLYEFLHVIIPIILMVGAMGILFLKSWARKTILFIFVPLVYIYSFAFAYMYEIGEGGGGIVFIIAFFSSLLITSPLIFFLTRPKVKEQFR